MAFCAKCGNALEEGALFCGNCGEKAGGTAAGPAPAQPANNSDIQSGGKNLTYNVVLKSFDDNRKISLIRRLTELASIGLKEAKDLVESAPCVLMKGVSKEQSVEIMNTLIAAGGCLELQNQYQTDLPRDFTPSGKNPD